MNHDETRELLGAYALGHLPEDEAAYVERHLDDCGPCRDDLAYVAPVVARLRALGPAATATPPPSLGDRVALAVARERAHRSTALRFRRASVALAAAASLVVAVGAGAVAGRSSTPAVTATPKGPFEPVPVNVAAPGVTANAGVVPHTWGVEIKLTAAGFDPGATYAVWVTTADGRRRSAGAFVGTGAKEMRCNLNSDVLRPDAAAFDVVDATGRTVLTGALPTRA